MYQGRDDVAQTRPSISAPTRFDSARTPRLAPNEQLRVFEGARILIATALPEAVERLRLALRELGAQILVHHPLEDVLEVAAPLDPQVVLLDRESLKGRSTQFFRRLHGDPRLRWASVVRVNASELTHVQVGTLEALALRLKAKLVPDAKLAGLARQDRPFLLRLVRLGPNRVLRGLESVTGAVRITMTGKKTLCRLDVQDGMVLGAHYKAIARPETLTGLKALAAFLAQEDGEVRVERRDRLTLHNIELPIGEALDGACKQLDSIESVLGYSALLEARNRANPFQTRVGEENSEAEELEDGAIEFVAYEEDQHTRRVDNPTAVLGPSKSEPASGPPPVPEGSKTRTLSYMPGAVSPNNTLRPAASDMRTHRPLPRLDVPSSARARPASSSTVKIRVTKSPPAKQRGTLRFAAFAVACVALGFTLTSAIRVLLVDEPETVAVSETPTLVQSAPAARASLAPAVHATTTTDDAPTTPAPSEATTVVRSATTSPQSQTAKPRPQLAKARPRVDSLSKIAAAAAATTAPLTEQPLAEQPLAEQPLADQPESRSADYRRANRLIAAGNIEQAIEEMSILLETDPNDHRAMANIASANLKAGQTTDAIRWAEKTVKLRPSNPAYQNLLGDALGLLGEREQALVHWNEAKRLKSANAAENPDE